MIIYVFYSYNNNPLLKSPTMNWGPINKGEPGNQTPELFTMLQWMILFFLCLLVFSSLAFCFTALLNIQVKVRARDYLWVGGTEFSLSPVKTFITQPRGLSLDPSRKEEKKKKSPLRCQFCFALLCPKLTLFQVTRRQIPAEGKVLDLNSISSIHSDTPPDLILATSSVLTHPQPHWDYKLPPSTTFSLLQSCV